MVYAILSRDVACFHCNIIITNIFIIDYVIQHLNDDIDIDLYIKMRLQYVVNEFIFQSIRESMR